MRTGARPVTIRCGIGIAAMLALLLTLGCGGEDDTPAGPEVYALIDSLIIERSDATTVDIANRTLSWCGEWEPGTVPDEAIHLVAGLDPLLGQNNPRWLYLRGVLADLTVGTAYPVANDFVWNEPEGIELYLYDDPNEYGTWTAPTRGEIVFEKLQCGGNGVVRFRIDAVIGSEPEGGDSVRVSGVYQSPVGDSPF